MHLHPILNLRTINPTEYKVSHATSTDADMEVVPANYPYAENPELWSVCCLGSFRNQMEVLLAKGANVEETGQIGTKRTTPLEIAVSMQRVPTVKLLLRYDAQIAGGANHILTLVPYWERETDVEIVKVLLEAGASVSATNDYGSSPLHVAAYGGSVGAVDLLLKNKADVSSIDRTDSTALHRAAFSGSVEVVQKLIHHGANVQAEKSGGETAEDVARSRGHPRVVDMLQTETLHKGKCVALAMGLHERLGVESRVRNLEPEVVQMVMQYVGN
jgi:ankyrin repeat protein